jgi:sensor histidine kinase YesM
MQVDVQRRRRGFRHAFADDGVGLANIRERLRLLFGSKAPNWSIEQPPRRRRAGIDPDSVS